MTYQELETAINENIGDGDAQLELLTSENVAVLTRCLSKTYPAVFQNSRRPDAFLAEYLQLRSDLSAALNFAAVITYFTPANVLLARYGEDYVDTYVQYVDAFRGLGYADPDQAAADALEVVMDNKIDSQNVENLTLC